MKEYLKEQLERTNYWLSFSEAKNGALVALNIAFMAVCTQVSNMNVVFCSLTCIILLVSSVFCLLSFYPNLSNKFQRNQNGVAANANLIFYGDIAKMQDKNMYINSVENRYHININANEREQCDDLATEVLINSQITILKYKLFKYAVRVDVCAVIVFIVGIICA